VLKKYEWSLVNIYNKGFLTSLILWIGIFLPKLILVAKKQLLTIFIIVLIILTTELSLSQPEREIKDSWTLKDCINYALENHPTIISANQNCISAQAQIKKTKSDYYPQVDLVSQNSYFNIPVTAINQGQLIRTQESYQILLQLNQTFFRLGRKEEVEQSKQNLLVAQANLQKVKQDLVLEVIKSFYDVLRAEYLAKVSEEALNLAKEHLQMTQEMVSAGTAASVDILPLEVEVANNNLALIKSVNQIKLAKSTLKRAIGLSTLEDIKVAEPLVKPLEGEFELNQLLTDAYNLRPELVEIESRIRFDELAVRINKLKHISTFDISGNYNREIYTSLTPRPEYWSVNARVVLPLFDGGYIKGAITSAEADLNNLKAQREQLKQDIGFEVEQAYLKLNEAKELIKATEKNVEEAELSLKSAEERYKEGVAIIIEVIEAQTKLATAKVNHIQSLYDYNIALANLKRAIGKEMY